MLGDLPVTNDDRVLVDYRTADDAGVYKLDEGRALVQTVDFFTPIVDDPRVYGRIAAANALSDVYAMGGRPLTALAIAGFPKDAERRVLSEIFLGGYELLRETGVALLGGHTVQDQEIKFGYAVTGDVDPARVLSNAGARRGDRLILTKPLGTGVIATALKFGRTSEAIVAGAVASMTTTNQRAAEILGAQPVGVVHACTDVTGFGLIGHATEMAQASGCTLTIEAAAVPLLPGAADLVAANTPGGGRTNQAHFGPGVLNESAVGPSVVQLLFDPQTSGGLLVALEARVAAGVCDRMRAAGLPAAVVGEVTPARGPHVRLR